jgi:hypothetical protein
VKWRNDVLLHNQHWMKTVKTLTSAAEIGGVLYLSNAAEQAAVDGKEMASDAGMLWDAVI